MSHTLIAHINDSNFQAEVLEQDQPVLVDIWAEWCGPCRAIAPVLEQLAPEYRDRIYIKKLDADANPLSVSNYGIRSIPTLILFENGKEVERITGLAGKEKIKAILNHYSTETTDT